MGQIKNIKLHIVTDIKVSCLNNERIMACISPAYHASKNIGKCIIAPNQWVRTLSNGRKLVIKDGFSENSTSQDTFQDGENSGEIFHKNISLISPKFFTKFFYNDLKLKFVEEQKESEPGIELLRNIAAKYDYWLVRKNQANLLYYRLEMMSQRLAFLRSVGLDYHQKLKQIQKSPPPLLFTFTDCSYTGKLTYLRGLLHKDEGEFMHLFYPVTNKVTADQRIIQTRLKSVEDELRIKTPAAI